jgi:hypothetical protein
MKVKLTEKHMTILKKLILQLIAWKKWLNDNSQGFERGNGVRYKSKEQS